MRRGLALRRIVLTSVLAAAVVTSVLLGAQWQRTLPRFPYLSGWFLFALMLLLTAYNARKKLPFIPLISSRLWLQIHLYVGLFTGFVFLIHLYWKWPKGVFEFALAALFTAVTASGIAGWWLSRVLPARLTTVGGEVPFDRIPEVLRTIRSQAERLGRLLPPTPRRLPCWPRQFYLPFAGFAAASEPPGQSDGGNAPLPQR
jgi:hypothetical protein